MKIASAVWLSLVAFVAAVGACSSVPSKDGSTTQGQPAPTSSAGGDGGSHGAGSDAALQPDQPDGVAPTPPLVDGAVAPDGAPDEAALPPPADAAAVDSTMGSDAALSDAMVSGADTGTPTSNCPWGELSVGGVCTPVPTMNLSMGTTTTHGASGPQQATTQNQVYFYQPTAPAAPAPTTSIDGCAISMGALGGTATTPALFAGDVGVVTVTGGSNGTNVFMAGGKNGSYTSSLGTTAPFTGGETLVINATEGASFPAFSTMIVAPNPLVLDQSAVLSVGTDFPLSWSGSDGTGQVSVEVSTFTATTYASASCVVSDNGMFTSIGVSDFESELEWHCAADSRRSRSRFTLAA